jgi:RNA polymerase sigma factor (sigma-70 family)
VIVFCDVLDMMNDKLTEKQKQLITDNYPLVDDFLYKTFRNYNIPQNLHDPFASDVRWKFCLAARKFDKSKGFKFSTYAYGGFKFALKNILQTQDKYIVESYIYSKKTEKIALINSGEKIEINFLDNCIKKSFLTKKERDMLYEYYYSNLSYREVGERHGLKKERSRTTIKEALIKIKEYIEDSNLEMEDFYEK